MDRVIIYEYDYVVGVRVEVIVEELLRIDYIQFQPVWKNPSGFAYFFTHPEPRSTPKYHYRHSCNSTSPPLNSALCLVRATLPLRSALWENSTSQPIKTFWSSNKQYSSAQPNAQPIRD